MTKPKRICICDPQVPFAKGGAEIHVQSLHEELLKRGFESEIVQIPSTKWYSDSQIIKDCLTWRLVDLTESGTEPIDMVIAMRFPAYIIKHPCKVVWLIHQFRSVYDLFGTKYSNFNGKDPAHVRIMELIKKMDVLTLAEAQYIYTNAQNTANRLAQYNNLPGEALYHPSRLDPYLHNSGYGDYVLSVGRLEKIKRVDLLIKAMAYTHKDMHCLITGRGTHMEELKQLAVELGVSQRVEFLGFVDNQQLVELYANCFAVYYAPYDEDYGYVTLESFKSFKPVITMTDSGGVLEFVIDDVNGYICRANDIKQMANRINQLFRQYKRCEQMGQAGYDRVKDINWDNVIEKLTQAL